MEKKDIMLIAALRKDSRKKSSKIAKELRVPVSSVHENIEKSKERYLNRFTALLDFDKLGYSIRANIAFAVAPQDRDTLLNFLKKQDCVNSLYKINAGFDFLVEVVFKTVEELEAFVEVVEKSYIIYGKQVHHILKEIVREKFMASSVLV
ncbi:Lrp/AsnC family transcriptional regulator [Candidatus Woesearchaeota archaeon]|nr:Lrp/AsnC family transcriptional regulator [Candidatus Woesearchaeota archaeon]MBW3014025.1 Lrp/AsnC family transcriptional regulator [Candidatus Woesearchaeota archaeon]